MQDQINNLKISMAELKSDISFIRQGLIKNDEANKQNVADHKEIIAKIDHLGDTFQGKIQDKADQKEVMNKFCDIENKYLTKEAFTDKFSTVQKLVYGMAGAILMAILTTVVYAGLGKLFK